MTSQMFLCQEKPALPAGDGTDADLATYMVRLVLAHEDCAGQLQTVQKHLEINGAHIADESGLTPSETPKFLGIF